MPLFCSKSVFQDSKLGIWLIEEDEIFFRDQLSLTEDEKLLIEQIKGKRKLEWLSSRHLIHLISSRQRRAEILKDEHGKPYIADSEHYISFSHSHGMSAVIASPRVVGIDIQFIVPKITRIAHKFVRKDELDQIQNYKGDSYLELLHIIWGAKESLYKAYGKRSLDFKAHMQLGGINWNGEGVCKFEGRINKEEYSSSFILEAEKINNHILVYAEVV